MFSRIVKIGLFTFAIFFLMFSTATVFAQSSIGKIGIVDMLQVLNASKAGKAAQAHLAKKAKSLESDLKAKETELRMLKEKLEKEALVMDKNEREKRIRDMDIKAYDINMLQRKYEVEVKVLRNKLSNQINKEIARIVQQLGKQQGLTLVIDSREGGVVYAPDAVKLTDKVIIQYNAEYAKKKK